MKRNAKIARDRLKSVLLTDKIAQPEKFKEFLRAEVMLSLNNYFEIIPETCEINFSVGENAIDISISIKADRIKPYGNFIAESV